MNKPGGSIDMSQDFKVLRPAGGRAYPIPCDEWDGLTGRLKELSGDPWFFQTVASTLIGASVSTFITIVLGGFEGNSNPNALVIAWAATIVTGICGTLSGVFAREQGKHRPKKVGDVVLLMENIERRFLVSGTVPGTTVGVIFQDGAAQAVRIRDKELEAMGRFLTEDDDTKA